jgi:hypothetical protein
MPGGTDERDELVYLFVGLEEVWAGQFVDRLDRADALAAQKLLDRDMLSRAPLWRAFRVVRSHELAPNMVSVTETILLGAGWMALW